MEGEREVHGGKEGMCMANTDCRHFVDTHHLLACISCVVKQNVLRFNLYICRNNKLAQRSEIEFSIQVMTFKIYYTIQHCLLEKRQMLLAVH